MFLRWKACINLKCFFFLFFLNSLRHSFFVHGQCVCHDRGSRLGNEILGHVCFTSFWFFNFFCQKYASEENRTKLKGPHIYSIRISVLLGCAYRPPDSLITDFCSALELLFSKINPITHETILLGDFNATSLKWLSSDLYNKVGRHLEPFTLQMGLDQFVSSPTHFTADGRSKSCSDQAPSFKLMHYQSAREIWPRYTFMYF